MSSKRVAWSAEASITNFLCNYQRKHLHHCEVSQSKVFAGSNVHVLSFLSLLELLFIISSLTAVPHSPSGLASSFIISFSLLISDLCHSASSSSFYPFFSVFVLTHRLIDYLSHAVIPLCFWPFSTFQSFMNHFVKIKMLRVEIEDMNQFKTRVQQSLLFVEGLTEQTKIPNTVKKS